MLLSKLTRGWAENIIPLEYLLSGTSTTVDVGRIARPSVINQTLLEHFPAISTNSLTRNLKTINNAT